MYIYLQWTDLILVMYIYLQWTDLILVMYIYLQWTDLILVMYIYLQWTYIIGHALERTEPEISGLIIPGSARNSDLSTSIAFVKGKIKIYIQNSQKLGHIYLW